MPAHDERDDLWRLLDDSREASADPDERLTWLRDHLATRPLPEILRFQVTLGELRRPLDTWVLWTAATRILGGFCSDDSFWYFQPWLLGLGRDAYERVVADPDALADLPEIRRLAKSPRESWPEADWPQWEALNYVAEEAYEELTGKETGLEEALLALDIDLQVVPEPPDDNLSEEARTKLLPNLCRLFP
ncbi:DUF4240 domain-containing protein [Embleya sp. AB8]|uniref:DUF4240 domain-containing protein n=1 Tax=Embleya sp. AB8 TaxID=3156304 RepID=UPI003C782A7B